MKHLVFQLQAPLMSWGNEMARQTRPSDGHPRKCAVLGMIGAAMGLSRGDPSHGLMNDALGFATVVLRPGSRLVDYHTVATPTGPKKYATRQAEAEASDYTVQTEREYLSDAYYLVALWLRDEGTTDIRATGGSQDVRVIKQFLEEPTWELFAGRKCCSFGLPLAPEIRETPTLAQAFQEYEGLYEPLVEGTRFQVYYERHPAPGVVHVTHQIRQDHLVHLEKKLYRGRDEFQAQIEIKMKEETACSSPK